MEKVRPEHPETNTQAAAIGGGRGGGERPSKQQPQNTSLGQTTDMQRPERKSWGVRFEGNKLFEKLLCILENLENHMRTSAGNMLKNENKKLRIQ